MDFIPKVKSSIKHAINFEVKKHNKILISIESINFVTCQLKRSISFLNSICNAFYFHKYSIALKPIKHD